MSKRAFDKIKAGLEEVEAFMAGTPGPDVTVHIPPLLRRPLQAWMVGTVPTMTSEGRRSGEKRDPL